MHPTLKVASLAAAMVLGAFPSYAQGIDLGMKFGAGTVLNTADEQHSRATIGFALTSDFKLGESKAITLEARYRTIRADFYEATKLSTTIVPSSSVDMRRNRVESIGLALGYRAGITQDLFWQAGASLDHSSAAQEVLGQITLLPAPGGTAKVEGLNTTPGKTGVMPGAYAGLHFKANKSFFVESNVVYYAFKQAEYTPASYTADYKAKVDSKNVSKVILEFNAGFRF